MLIAAWTSAKGKWTAELHTLSNGGYRLGEFKNGQEVGCMFRPASYFLDPDPITYFEKKVQTGFDVTMKRVF